MFTVLTSRFGHFNSRRKHCKTNSKQTINHCNQMIETFFAADRSQLKPQTEFNEKIGYNFILLIFSMI